MKSYLVGFLTAALLSLPLILAEWPRTAKVFTISYFSQNEEDEGPSPVIAYCVSYENLFGRQFVIRKYWVDEKARERTLTGPEEEGR